MPIGRLIPPPTSRTFSCAQHVSRTAKISNSRTYAVRPANKQVYGGGSSLIETLVEQDPYQRIWFIKPLSLMMFNTESARAAHLNSIWHNYRYHETHIIPFWTLCILSDLRSEAIHRHTGGQDYANVAQRFCTEIGLNIAAVPDSHWCSGLYFREVLRMRQESIEKILNGSMINLSDFLPSPTPAPYIGDFRNVGAPAPLHDNNQYDPVTSPKFAWGPPRLGRSDMENIISAHDATFGEWEDIHVRVRDTKLFAIPTYRLLYKMYLSSGEIAVTDGELNDNGHNLMVDWPKGKAQTSNHVNYNNGLIFSRTWLDHPERGIGYCLMGDQGSSSVVSTLFNAMRRGGPIRRETWEDDKIIPLIGSAAVPHLQSLMEYTGKVLCGQGQAFSEPSFPIEKKATTTSSSSLFSKVDPTIRAKRSVASNVSPASSLSSRLFGPSSLKSSAWTSSGSHSTKRQAVYEKFARAKAEKIGSSIYGPSEQYALRKLHDRNGYYAELGVENLAVELLDKSREKEVNSILKEKYYTLCKIKHSDIGGAEEDQVRLNRAYEQVETYEQRRNYQLKPENCPSLD
ncbi:hypothetical protein C343_02032 [Cryptococcus neoformans C23]|uniref:J domain-containing protein n=1 Tax=Cryptococcus neoformans (strain H99 / ATCC 208821 / CBS 10515 / FGSC 9487) TaxID=235443 RepID=J9W1T8_CRYN9|nr:hypothetical protein CNAG_01869 [Cryptococcus neoformans var. grubii H99]AFR98065.2 hypothetical protein CNAG_01869 [Cryptococcus neoformans var. grubii H99]AUB28166.1 hypothetical protein CKF44_01869 [Cryptococcus neoformans var. grubii]OWZ33897.1 hypothetical protein C347_02100 [Cryptococcus neoformans var. grubii AD2-60a]OWZ46025.1 hypothetical protein C343_02032 [Cryptococcus neoformans var. grubii C23]|eukprot:XP_012052482.1 hypothetical protein CNAG_01869 [Cryptococcus neoformans var. grubii H99]